MRDARLETLDPRREVHGSLEGENGMRRGVAGAEVYYGRGVERAPCAMGKYESWGGQSSPRRIWVLMAGDGILGGVVLNGENGSRNVFTSPRVTR